MAAPNLVNVATITGKTDTFTLTNTLTTSLVINAAASDDVYKINSIVVANTTTAAHTVTLAIDDSSNTRKIANAISVPANSALVVTDKNSGFYLEEGHTLEGGADAASKLDATVAYEVLTD
tara:strand:+ start:171 stop:533 length:363 start_codon:yes stop_codon:yes gene_type:complete